MGCGWGPQTNCGSAQACFTTRLAFAPWVAWARQLSQTGEAKSANFTKGTEPTSREQVSRSERWDSWGWSQGSSRRGKGGPAKSIRPVGSYGAPSSPAHSRAGIGKLKKTPRSSGRSTCQTPPQLLPTQLPVMTTHICVTFWLHSPSPESVSSAPSSFHIAQAPASGTLLYRSSNSFWLNEQDFQIPPSKQADTT